MMDGLQEPGGPPVLVCVSSCGALKLALLHGLSRVAEGPAQGIQAHQAQAQDRAPCLTSHLPKGWDSDRWGGGRRAGEVSATLEELGIFRSFSFFCFPDFSLPPQAVTAAASNSPPAGPAGVRSTASAGRQKAGQGAEGLRNSLGQPEHPLPVSDSAGKFKRGKVFLCLSMCLGFPISQKRGVRVHF